LRSSREDTTRVDAGRGDVESLGAFALFDDGDDAALRAANDAREAALYPDGLLKWKRILQRLNFTVFHCDRHGRFTGRPGNLLRVGSMIVSLAELRPLAERHAGKGAASPPVDSLSQQ
jgi:hypothetical protein